MSWNHSISSGYLSHTFRFAFVIDIPCIRLYKAGSVGPRVLSPDFSHMIRLLLGLNTIMAWSRFSLAGSLGVWASFGFDNT